jgi:O-antigen/teichoic acid export membrane protein
MHLQINRIATVAPGWITPTLVAGLLGPQAVGLLMWASTLGRKPLEVLENVVRVALPQFARLQHNLAEVEQVLRRYATLSLFFCGLWFSVLAVAGHDLVRLIYTDQWLPGMPALLLFAGAGMLASVRWLANAAVIGVGRGRFAAKVSMIAAVTAVVASILLVLRLGIIGVPLGQFLGIALATPWLLWGLRPGAATLVLRASLPVLISIAVAIFSGAVVVLAPLPSAQRGIVTGATVSLVYIGVAWAVAAPWLRAAVREEIVMPGRWLRKSPTS